MFCYRRAVASAALFLVAIGWCARSARMVTAELVSDIPARTFAFTYQVHVPASAEIVASSHVWIPIPQADGYQEIHALHIDSPVAYSQGRDPEYGNTFAMFTPTPKQITAGFDVALHFTATRREHKVPLDRDTVKSSSSTAAVDVAMLQRYLQPDKLVPLNATIAQLAKEHTAGDTTPLQKARQIYEYVVSTMRYDKSGEGWGRGDAVWACTSKRGNCTDFHSLLIGMMRSAGIPARFAIGFPLPEGKTQGGDILGYHCWAEFYLDGSGWIPVDASEAWKNPAKREYFFGANDYNRVFFTFGRDIQLSSVQKGAPLNYFIYPYAETNGEPIKNLQTHFSFRDVTLAPRTAAH